MATYKRLGSKGYRVIKGGLSPDLAKELSQTIVDEAIDLVFTRQGFEVDSSDPETLKLLTDQKLRVEVLGEEAKRCTSRGGNTRQPILGKSTGMIHIHFLQEVLEKVLFNRKLYAISSTVNGTSRLAFRSGPERVSIKAKGATDMPEHIDSNLFYDSVNYDFRIQSLVCLSIDTEINPRDSGTLCVIPYFQHYWEFARRIFHPLTGFPECRFPDIKSRFFVLPTGKRSFDKFFLPFLKEYGALYADFLEGKEPPKSYLKYFRRYQKEGITVPSNSKGYLEKLVWTPVVMEPGDIVFWHQYLPHRSLRNKSDTPRIAAYYNLFPVDEDWFGSEEQTWVADQFSSAQFYYGTDNGKYPRKIINVEEHLKIVEEGRVKEVAAISSKNSFRRKLTGQESY